MAEQNTSPPAKGSSSPLKRRRWLRALGWTFAATLLALALALGSLLWWIGRDDSLNQTLQRVAGWLPADQSLVAKEVTGSVKNGGRIGWLQWQSPTMKVEVREAQIGWQFRPLLLSRTLKLGEVHIAELRIGSTPDPDKPASEPLQSLTLPVKIELPFKVDQIIWQGPPEAVVQDLRGRYEYTGTDHELKVSSLRFAQGTYQAQLKLQGAAPMALQAEATGDVQVPNPLDKSDDALNTIAVQARVTAEGTLATEAARLTIKANASAEASPPGPGTQDPPATAPKREKSGLPSRSKSEAATAEAGPMQADVEASIMPWRSQPLLAAKAQLQNLDVSAFWPQGPRTLLTGQLHAGPDETVSAVADLEAQPWKLNTSFSNALPGPWDRQRLPVAELAARIDFDGQQWQVNDSRIQIGKGHIALGGQFTPSTRLFEGLATVEQLNPADLYSTMEAAPVEGEISAKAVQAEPGRDRKSVV